MYIQFHEILHSSSFLNAFINYLLTAVLKYFYSSKSQIFQAILQFLEFLGNWEKFEKKIPVSKSTLVGLKVTLRATLKILDMLNIECKFKYLMTATLSQDPLGNYTNEHDITIIDNIRHFVY